jgi:predicted dehydrogenase
MLRVGIVGCGKIADSHAAQIGRVEGCEIVGVCDSEPLMAQQLYERFPIEGWFGSLLELFDKAKPDVVHITTPADSHFEIARECLERGCHVYVEKPFTVDEGQARQLVALATARSLKLTVGHDDQFRHAARRMRELVKTGFLGSGPVHMESCYGYPLGRNGYGGALLGDKNHWVRRLPGGLLQNIISHGIASIAEYLTEESPRVIAHGFVSESLRRRGETGLIDELRVIIVEECGTTAYFTFSSQIRPALHEFRIYGTRNGIIVDHDQERLIRLKGSRYQSYAEKFIPPIALAGQEVGNAARNMRAFLARDFHSKSGMKYLIEAFYRSVVSGEAPPIPYGEIVRTARVMDTIFGQLGRSTDPTIKCEQQQFEIRQAVEM